MKLLRILTLTAAAVAIQIPAALAQSGDPLAAREARVPPAVAAMQARGIKLTFLGEEGGLRGYLGESANGQMQTFYLAPDGSHFVAGILFRSEGTNVTGIQIGEMRARFDAAAESLGSQTAPGGPGSDEDAGPDAPDAHDAAEAEEPAPAQADVPPSVEADTLPLPASEDEAAEPMEPQAGAMPSLALPDADGPAFGAAGNPSELWISRLDRDEFIEAAEATPYFEVGSLNAPVTLWMVADPKCPYCHQAWDYLRQSVYDRKVKVRVILIAALEGSLPIAQDMLSRPVPARAWLQSDGGQRPLAGEAADPLPESAGWLDANLEFARRFNVDRTPFLGYTGEDGQFYSALGLPSDLRAFFHAAGI